MERRYSIFIYGLFFGVAISVFFILASEGANVYSVLSTVFLSAAHDSIYCWRHGNHVFPTIDPLWVYLCRRNKEEYYEKYYLVSGLVAAILGSIFFCIAAVVFIVTLPSLI